MKSSTPPSHLRVIDGGKQARPVTVPFPSQRDGTQRSTGPPNSAFPGDLDPNPFPSALIEEVEEIPSERDDTGDEEKRDRRNRSSRPTWTPGDEHVRFARSVVSVLPRQGSLYWITLNPPPGVDFESMLDAFCCAITSWKCAHYTVRHRGTRGKMHWHSIVFTPDPTGFQQAFVAWMTKHGVRPAATKVKHVTGYDDFVIGCDAGEVTRSLTNLCEYPTRTDGGGHVRPCRSDTRATGFFVKPRKDFVLPDEPNARSAPERTCHECGAPLLTNARKSRRWCSDACKKRFSRCMVNGPGTRWRLSLRRRSSTPKLRPSTA